ncbi:MAG: hypothetical protein OQK46_09540 [Gammaproteobacteria bacterium]|nr:hypothetical protein [Gammaproteobacteria bacterium]
MSIFNTTDFERQGNIENDLLFESNEETCKAILTLSENTLRSLKIFTPDLEHKLYDNDQFIKNILSFVRGNRHAQVQILVSDISHSIKYGHRLLRLAQQLSSAMQIRITPEEYKETTISFIQLDQSNFIFKPDSSKQLAIQANCKNRSNSLLEFFTPAWDQAEKSPQSQIFHI